MRMNNIWTPGGVEILPEINANEIPRELSRENLIFSLVKTTCYLHTWEYHLYYCYIINPAFDNKKLLKWNGLVFHWCLYNKINITWPLGDTKFLFSCWKNVSLVRWAHSWNIFQHSKRNFVSPRSHVISSIFVMFGHVILYLFKFYVTIKMFMISFINSERKLHFSFLWRFPIKIVTIITDKLPSLF